MKLNVTLGKVLFCALFLIVGLGLMMSNGDFSTGEFPLGNNSTGEITIHYGFGTTHSVINASVTAPASHGVWASIIMDNNDDLLVQGVRGVYVAPGATYKDSEKFRHGDLIWVNMSAGGEYKNQTFHA